MTQTKSSIEKGVAYLSSQQQADGSFLSFTVACKKVEKAKEYNSPFFASLILSSLRNINSVQSSIIKDNIAKMLLGQRSDLWTFNYWMRISKQAKEAPYPDDLDDTFCALAALFLHNKKYIPGSVMANVVSALTATESQEGGPYFTWIVASNSPKEWMDIDIAVNSNVAFFLSLHDVELENIINLIEAAIEQKNFRSPYYVSEYSVIYFISRFYRGFKKNDLICYILDHYNKKTCWNNNPLDTALAVNALLNFGYKGRCIWESIEYLRKTQQRNGSWRAVPFVVELVKGRVTYTAESPAITTGFCIEALGKINDLQSKKRDMVKEKEKGEKKRKHFEFIVRKVIGKRFSSLDVALRERALNFLNLILEKNEDGQIILLPYIFAAKLKDGCKIPMEDVKKMAIANVYGWMAYTIFDDFIDDEGDPKMLSIATICLREVTEIFQMLAIKHSGIPFLFSKVMDIMDNANAWEIDNCRIELKGNKISLGLNLPDYRGYSRLADRSMGHILSPMVSLSILGYGWKSSQMEIVTSFFKHYIIAKQIDDDMHDWEEDFAKGHLSSVVSILLEQVKRSGKFRTRKYVDIVLDKEELKAIFWHETVIDCCNLIVEHLNEASKLLEKITVLRDYDEFERLILAIERRMEKTMEDQKQTLAFLSAYMEK